MLILLSACSKVLHWSRAEPRFYVVDSSATDTAMLAMIAPYSEELWSEMNEVIGHNAQTLTKERPEGTLNNWVADVMKEEAERFTGAKADFAVANYGGIRISSLGAGPVTLGRMYEVMPFDNTLVIVEANGEILRRLFNDMAASGGWPVSRHIQMTITDTIATEIVINGSPLDPVRTYHVVMPDYIANGGDNCFYLKPVPRQTLSYLVRDALIEHVRTLAKSGKSIVSARDGRVKVIETN